MFTYAVASDPAVAGYAMVSDRFLAVLSTDADDATALRLWHALSTSSRSRSRSDSGGDEAAPNLDTVLSAMAAHGIGTLPDFALVELVDVATRTVALAVRGGAQIALAGGDVRTGDGAGPWHESTAREVTGLTLQLGPGPALLGRLPLGRGVVRADRLDWGAGADAEASPPAAPASRDSSAPTGPLRSTHRPASEPPLETLRRDRLPEAADPVEDRTELSRVHRRPGTRPILRFGDDRVLELDLPVVFGRSPRPASHPGARLVSLPSPRREISGAHLEVRLEGDALVARDLDSTNGTIVREPDGSMQLLRHGSSARLTRGASLDLGDGTVAIFDVTDGTVR